MCWDGSRFVFLAFDVYSAGAAGVLSSRENCVIVACMYPLLEVEYLCMYADLWVVWVPLLERQFKTIFCTCLLYCSGSDCVN